MRPELLDYLQQNNLGEPLVDNSIDETDNENLENNSITNDNESQTLDDLLKINNKT